MEFTAKTEIKILVNCKEVATINYDPEIGLWYQIPVGVDKSEYIQGQFAIAKASSELLVNKIKLDSKRIIESRDFKTQL